MCLGVEKSIMGLCAVPFVTDCKSFAINYAMLNDVLPLKERFEFLQKNSIL